MTLTCRGFLRESSQAESARLSQLLGDWNVQAAYAEIDRAVALSPNNPFVLCGKLIETRREERFEESQQLADRVISLASRDPFWRTLVMRSFYESRLYDRAISEAEQNHRLDPDFGDDEQSLALDQAGRFFESYQPRLATLRRCGERCEKTLKATELGWQNGGYEGLSVPVCPTS